MLRSQRRSQSLALSHWRRQRKTRPVGSAHIVFPNPHRLPALNHGIRIQALRKDTALRAPVAMVKLSPAARAWLQGPWGPTRLPHLSAIPRTRRGVASPTQAGSQELQQPLCSRAALLRTSTVSRNARTQFSEWSSSGGPAQTRSRHGSLRRRLSCGPGRRPIGSQPGVTAQRTSGGRWLIRPRLTVRRRTCAPLPLTPAPQSPALLP